MTEQKLLHPAVAPEECEGVLWICCDACWDSDTSFGANEDELRALCLGGGIGTQCKPYYHLLAQEASAPAPEVPVRYPVAIAIDADGDPGVVANDGTMWFRYEREWHQLPPLPQPEAETNDD